MSADRNRQTLETLGRALDRLEEAVAEPEQASRLVIDGTIQRFEFAIELFWKALKRLLEAEGVQTATPREALRAAYAAGWLDDEALWLGMLADRNRSSHLYDEAMARALWQRIPRHAAAMRAVHRLLGARAA